MVCSWITVLCKIVANVDGKETEVLPGVAFERDTKRFTDWRGSAVTANDEASSKVLDFLVCCSRFDLDKIILFV